MNCILNKQNLKLDHVWQDFFQKYSATTKCIPTNPKRTKFVLAQFPQRVVCESDKTLRE